MDKKVQEFLAPALKIALTEEEQKTLREEILTSFQSDSVRDASDMRLQEGMDQEVVSFLQPAQSVTLDEEERQDVLQKVLSSPQGIFKENQSWWERVSLIFDAFSLPAVALFFLCVIVVGGGITLAADRTLPGDFLYPVKIHVNEPVWAGLIFSHESRALYESTRAVRRLEEAEALAETNQLDAQMREDITTNFQEHLDSIKEEIEELEEQGDTEAVVELQDHVEAWLKTHQEVLETIVKENPDEIGTEVQVLLDDVRLVSPESTSLSSEEKEEAETTSITVEEGNLEDSQESLRTAILQVAAVDASYVTLQKLVQTGALLLVEEKLTAARGALDDARAQMKEGHFSQARDFARSALRLSEEAKLILQENRKELESHQNRSRG